MRKMSSSRDIQSLTEQLKNIILNKPLLTIEKVKSPKLDRIQEMVTYLGQCLTESNEFLQQLSIGNLEAKVPNRYNFLASGLKEIHAGLRHLSWQATQVAKGDYKQRVKFLGDFSTAFNSMIEQLEEREKRLKDKTVALEQSRNLLISIINGIEEWIVVIDKVEKKVIYSNQAVRCLGCDVKNNRNFCGYTCGVIEKLIDKMSKDENDVIELECEYNAKFVEAKAYPIEWNEVAACAYLIRDITNRKREQAEMENAVFKDELTGAYNRRYCMKLLSELQQGHKGFSVCFIDLDGLKYVNDNFGHHTGDRYIKFVAKEFFEHTRDSDRLCRIGGDEFIVLFPNCTPKKIRGKLAELYEKISHKDTEYPMSISYGLIYICKDNQLLPQEILAKADKKMYHWKNRKKNRKMI